MKKVLMTVLMLGCVAIAMPALAQETATKGASAEAYEHASDEAIFNRTADWFATVGKSDEEKAKILAERKAERTVKKTEQEAKKAQKKAEQEAKRAQQRVKEEAQKAEKAAAEAGAKVEGAAGEASKGVQGLMKGPGKAK